MNTQIMAYATQIQKKEKYVSTRIRDHLFME